MSNFNFLKYLIHKNVILNILLVLNLGILTVVVIQLILKTIVFGGEDYVVPNFKYCTPQEINQMIEDLPFDIEVIDSNIFIKNQDPNTVVDQFPTPNSKVKPNRVIQVTLTSKQTRTISFPSLKGLTLKEAKNILRQYDISIKNIYKTYYIAENEVLSVMDSQNRIIREGKKFKVTESVNLVIGKGLSEQEIDVPSLVGASFNEAQKILARNTLFLGQVTYDNPGDNSSNSVIYNQYPTSYDKTQKGQIIDVWLKREGEYIQEESNHDSKTIEE